MRRAIVLARMGYERGDGGPFGAVVVQDGEIVGEGWNRVLVDNDPTAHAEIVALRAAGAKLGKAHCDDCVLYSTGEPCSMCLSASYWAHIKHIYYGFSVEQAAFLGFCMMCIYISKSVKPRNLVRSTVHSYVPMRQHS
jgi:Cytosine/adenosine deaminases